MASKRLKHDKLGEITLYKRKTSRNIRLSVAHDGSLRLTLPPWVPYRLGLQFALDKHDWIIKNRTAAPLLEPSMRVGKAHTLVYRPSEKSTRPNVRLTSNRIVVSLPSGIAHSQPAAQAAAKRGAIRALKAEAEALLPGRLEALAQAHGFDYSDVKVRPMKSRWGSCNQQKSIVLNIYLMQLPWRLIDYVILHELLHTRIMAHGKPFWDELGRHVSDLPDIRKTMRTMRPVLGMTAA